MKFHLNPTASATIFAATMALSFAMNSGGAQAGGDGWMNSSSHSCYARADFAASFNRDPDATYGGPLPGGDTAPRGPVTTESLDNSYGFDVGFGCAASSYMSGGSMKDAPVRRESGLRADVTYSFRNGADFEGVPPPAPAVPPPAVPDPIQTKIESHAVMFNAYYDFQQTGQFRPYIGAGVGVARLSLDNVSVVNGNTVTSNGTLPGS